MCALDPLGAHAVADEWSQDYSETMRTDKDAVADSRNLSWFRHSTIWNDLLDEPGVFRVGENIVFNSHGVDVKDALVQLLKSGDHLCNIANPSFDGMGFGYVPYSGSRGAIITTMFTGDNNVQSTTGTLTVEDNFDIPGTPITCW